MTEKPAEMHIKSALFPAFLLITLILYAVLIPPFQNPDEIQHFSRIIGRIYPQNQYETLEKEVLAILWQTRWFVFVGMGQPDVLPDTLGNIKFLNGFSFKNIGQNSGQGIFHQVYAFLLSPFKACSLLTMFYLARFLSLLVSVFTLLLLYRFFIAHFKIPGGQLWLFFMLPQFLIIATSVNYEVPAIFFGTLFFYALFKLREHFSLMAFVFLNIGLFGSLFSKKGGWLFFLYLLAAVLIVKLDVRRTLAWLLTVFGVGIVFSWLHYLFPARMFPLYSNLFGAVKKLEMTVNTAAMAYSFFDFVWLVFKSFYARIGWMAFEMARGWYLIFLLFVLLAAAGWLFFYRKKRELPLFFYVAVVLALNLAALWEYYGNKGVLGQGRYFFPLILPFFLVLFVGIKKTDRRFFRNRSPVLTAFLMFNVLANICLIFFKIIPVFYLAFQSPHAGV